MKIRMIGALCLLLVVFGAAGSYLSRKAPPCSGIVRISQNGKEILRIDLSAAEDDIFPVEYQGRVNQIEIKKGHIRVCAADCPDHICMKSGWLKENGLPIVCMPNRLVIEQAESPEGLDAIQ